MSDLLLTLLLFLFFAFRKDHAYRHQNVRWWSLSGAEAAENADSYAQIVYQLSAPARARARGGGGGGGGGWRDAVETQEWWQARRRR